MAYAMAEVDAKKAPAGYIQTLSGGGKTYNVYMHRCWSAQPRVLLSSITKCFRAYLVFLCALEQVQRLDLCVKELNMSAVSLCAATWASG